MSDKPILFAITQPGIEKRRRRGIADRAVGLDGILRQHGEGREHAGHGIAALCRLARQSGDGTGLLQLSLLLGGDGVVLLQSRLFQRGNSARFLDDGLMIEKVHHANNQSHLQDRRKGNPGATSLATLGLFDPRLLDPGQHRTGKRIVIELEQRALARGSGCVRRMRAFPCASLSSVSVTAAFVASGPTGARSEPNTLLTAAPIAAMRPPMPPRNERSATWRVANPWASSSFANRLHATRA